MIKTPLEFQDKFTTYLKTKSLRLERECFNFLLKYTKGLSYNKFKTFDEDAYQETLLNFLSALSEYDENKSSVLSYFFRFYTFNFFKQSRHTSRQYPFDNQDTEVVNHLQTISLELIDNSFKEFELKETDSPDSILNVLNDVFNGNPEFLHIREKFLEGLSIDEIASYHNLNESTVKNKIYRNLKHFKAKLKEELNKHS